MRCPDLPKRRMDQEHGRVMVATRTVRMRRVVAAAGAVAGGVADIGYLRLIADQGTGIHARVAFVAGFVALMTALAGIGAILFGLDATASQLLLFGSSGGLLSLRLIAPFSH